MEKLIFYIIIAIISNYNQTDITKYFSFYIIIILFNVTYTFCGVSITNYIINNNHF